ncbi:hypothetical protein BH11MYX4_BH11MYX4_50700 [soil metagenome]
MPLDTVPAGTTLAGRYVVGNLLGEGGFGAVYDATQVNLGRRVAIKVLHADRIFQNSGLERFAREARAAAALGHHHIAQVTDLHTNPGEPPFFVMEHLSGRTLGAALAAEGPPALPERCRLTRLRTPRESEPSPAIPPTTAYSPRFKRSAQ